MPDYEFHCRRCEKNFSRHMSVEEHDADVPACPECKLSDEVQHEIRHVNVKTTRKSAPG